MMAHPSFLIITLGLLIISSHLVLAEEQIAQRQSPSYRGTDPCPAHCSLSGTVSSNWSSYHNLNELQACPQQLFLDFSLEDAVDDGSTLHHLRACTIWGSDWDNVVAAPDPVPATIVTGRYQLGRWNAGQPLLDASADLYSLARQMQMYFGNGYGPTNKTSIVYGLSGQASLGVYLGKALQNEGIGQVALSNFSEDVRQFGASGAVAMQLCDPAWDSEHIFGVIGSVQGKFSVLQDAMKTWSKAQCLSGFSTSSSITGPVFVTAAPFHPVSNGTDLNSIVASNSTNSTSTPARNSSFGQGLQVAKDLQRRADCRTIQVVSGDGCGSLATKCGISGNLFMTYNPQTNLCSTLQPFQHVCCSSGTLPNFKPQPNSDGSCATYTTVSDDSCWSIAASRSLTPDDLESFNKKTWGWNGCSGLWVGVKMCVSTGNPPMPAPVTNAVCGPQVPGTSPPSSGDLASLNPCPLNACCDVWGQCGTTAEFCTNTSTGAPGTAKPGTNGCISNCGTDIVRSSPPSTFRSIAYFEGFSLGRPCLNMDASQLDTSKYTHVHYAFATLSSAYSVLIGDDLATYEFEQFKSLKGPSRILSIGGWEFSTSSSTYNIFRQGMASAGSRSTMANNIANFVNLHKLDGVDIDWEYPGAPDIPGIPAASTSDGTNYLSFLVLLKNLLKNKSVSIAAPASYWYLKGFPIKAIGAVVDYVVYMTYDLHGQWDYGNKWSSPGCPNGNCLRSDVNITETINALVMITKAGVASNKVVVGVTSYGRSYKMTTPGCTGEMCTYTGPLSGATPGRCTGVGGYISDAEIKEIAASNRVNSNFYDSKSQTNILVYDNVHWVGYMSPSVKASRKTLYQGLTMGGVSDWAVDLEDFQPDPIPSGWGDFKAQIKLGNDPYIQGGPRSGNWTQLTCEDPAVEGLLSFTPEERWSRLDCKDAWADAVNIYINIDRPQNAADFSTSIMNTYHGTELSNCGSLASNNYCSQIAKCEVHKGSGPCAYEVMNSLIVIHGMYEAFYNALFQVSGILASGIPAFEKDFTPIPEPDNSLEILLDLIGLGALAVAAPFFNNYLKGLVYFVNHGDTLNNLKDITYAVIQTTISIVKDLNESGVDKWTPEKNADFAAYMGQVIWAWGNVTEQSVANLFNGSNTSINKLSDLIDNGKMIGGKKTSGGSSITGPPATPSNSDLQASIVRVFYTYMIPLAWTVSSNKGFVIDSGFDCSKKDPISPEYLDSGTASATGVCYNNRRYYIASPRGDAESDFPGCDTCPPVTIKNTFSAPPGLGKLDGSNYGGITKDNLVIGSLRTFQSNGNKNGAATASVTSKDTYNDLAAQDITTPGYIRLPVCGAAEAWSNWDKVLIGGGKADYPNYPCNP